MSKAKKAQVSETTEESVPTVSLPIYKAVGVVKLPNGEYASATFHIQDGKVIETVMSYPNVYGVASMDAKVAFSNEFLYGPLGSNSNG